MTRFKFVRTAFAALGLLAFAGLAAPHAAQAEAKHHLVIQVSSADPTTHTFALNSAMNVQKDLGMDNVEIEIVAWGPGLAMLDSAKTKEAERIASFSKYNIVFSACGNTMAGVKKKTGKDVQLVEGARVVKAGVIRIMDLQEKGWSSIRP